MRRPRCLRTVRRVRVSIDLEAVPGRPWRGVLRTGEDGAQPIAFDGRLELLRTIEALVTPTPEGCGPDDRREP